MASVRISRLRKLLLPLLLLCNLGAVAPARADDASRIALACDACNGLLRHMTGEPGTPFFFRSFEPANGGTALHPALENVAFTYDNALAMMALYGCGRAAEARRVADALVVAVQSDRFFHDGRLRNAYRSGPVALQDGAITLPGYWDAAQNKWIEDGYQVGSAVGSTVWGALALLAAFERTNEPVFLDNARQVMLWTSRENSDPANPGFFGGTFGHEPTPQKLTWKSTEHNTDVFAASTWLAALDPEGEWNADADHAQAFVEKMWDDGEGRLFVGSVPDSMRPNTATSGLDALLWPLIAVPALKERADRVLDWTERHHGVPGGFDFNDDRDGAWLEGTAQAALVYRLLGHAEKAEPLFETLRKGLGTTGLVYATLKEEITTSLQVGPASEPGDFKYYRLPHVGATGWTVLSALDWNPFVTKGGMPLDWEKQCPPKS